MARDPMRMPADMMALVHPNGTGKIQGGHGIPPPGSVKYVQYVQCGQQFGSSSNPPQQGLGRFIKRYAKTLGTIQILIGLIEIICCVINIALMFKNQGLPSILLSLSYLPFWSGILYIASGSVSVSAEKHLNSNLVNCSIGMNIASAVLASLHILGCVLALYILYIYQTVAQNGEPSSNLSSAFTILLLLLLLTLLQFCITVTVAHFGCRANCFTDDIAIAYVPCTITGESTALPEDNCTPTYVKIVPYMGV